MAAGENRIALGWFGFASCALFILVFAGIGDDVGSLGCCFWMFVSIIVILSGYDAKKKSAMKRVVYVQQQPVQQIIHHTYQQASIAPATQQSQISPTPAGMPSTTKSQSDWLVEAVNLERARNWEGAAMAYEKAGRYHEAGRIRQTYLEKGDDKVVLNIDRIGDTVLHDSVMMGGNEKEDPRDQLDP